MGTRGERDLGRLGSGLRWDEEEEEDEYYRIKENMIDIGKRNKEEEREKNDRGE